MLVCFIMFGSVLSWSVLSFLSCSVLFCLVLCCAVLSCPALCCSVLFCPALFCSVLFCSVPFRSVPFRSVLFCSVYRDVNRGLLSNLRLRGKLLTTRPCTLPANSAQTYILSSFGLTISDDSIRREREREREIVPWFSLLIYLWSNNLHNQTVHHVDIPDSWSSSAVQLLSSRFPRCFSSHVNKFFHVINYPRSFCVLVPALFPSLHCLHIPHTITISHCSILSHSQSHCRI